MSRLWCDILSSHAYPTSLSKNDRRACGVIRMIRSDRLLLARSFESRSPEGRRRALLWKEDTMLAIGAGPAISDTVLWGGWQPQRLRRIVLKHHLEFPVGEAV